MSRPILDFAQAMRLELASSGGGSNSQPQLERWFRDHYPTLFVLGGEEQSGRMNAMFSRPGLTPIIHRLTGGCGSLAPEHWAGLQNLADALVGNDADDRACPRAVGVGLCGGTRMLYKREPSVVRPGVTEVFPVIQESCPNFLSVGIAPRSSKMFITPHGMVVGITPGAEYFTIVHPAVRVLAVCQENSDEGAKWDVEYLRCASLCAEQLQCGWKALLTVYGGGETVEKEVLHWCHLSDQLEDARSWRVLLIGGSGGCADKLAGDKSWLADHPNVSVCGSSTASIRESLHTHGAIA